MVYLVAKNKNKHGCLAFQTNPGEHIVKIKRELFETVGKKGVQVVTITRPTAYGEYAPYKFVHNEEEFVNGAKALAE